MVTYECCNKRHVVKRGLWTPDEDLKLINYIKKFGHGCWTSVPHFAGLQRCGKSCRLRWINYLRPDLKKGAFTPQEALLILQLHQVVGNRWSQIAKKLPGRTDNEVKNFWNSSIKRKLMAHKDQLIAAARAEKKLAKARANNNFIPLPTRKIINNNTMLINPTIQAPTYNPPMLFQNSPMLFQTSPMTMFPNVQMINNLIPTIPNIPPPPPPPQPQQPIVIQGFDGPIDTTYDPNQMIIINPNIEPVVSPSTNIPYSPPQFDDLPSWPNSPYNYNSPPIEQNYGDDFTFMRPQSPNPMLGNNQYYYDFNANPEMVMQPAYNQDSVMFDATLPEMGYYTQMLTGVGSSFDNEPVQEYPTNINNIQSLMTSFSSPTVYSTAVSTFASTSTSDVFITPQADMPWVGSNF